MAKVGGAHAHTSAPAAAHAAAPAPAPAAPAATAAPAHKPVHAEKAHAPSEHASDIAKAAVARAHDEYTSNPPVSHTATPAATKPLPHAAVAPSSPLLGALTHSSTTTSSSTRPAAEAPAQLAIPKAMADAIRQQHGSGSSLARELAARHQADIQNLVRNIRS